MQADPDDLKISSFTESAGFLVEVHVRVLLHELTLVVHL
jgi:hypothetical protein